MNYSAALAIVAAMFAASILVPWIAEDPPDPRGAREPARLGTPDACQGPPVEGPAGPIDLLSGASETQQIQIPSFDGHRVPATLHRPVEATTIDRVPILLHSHGWAGTRSSEPGAFQAYHKGGFGVLSFDMRGHGDARTTSQARVHHVDFEIRDVSAVISYAANLSWVRLDGPGDPVVGSLGGSYGGGYQLLAAAFDDRIDAIAPGVTWNDLPQSLAPNGAPKSAWVDFLYFTGLLRSQLHPTIHHGFGVMQAENRVPNGQRAGEPDLKTQFTVSSPKTYAQSIRVPTLLLQGANDTLFNVNEAVRNYEQILATCTPVRLVTHLGGHILNTRGSLPGGAPTAAGIQGPSGGSPCGPLTDLTVRWYQRHLWRMSLAPEPAVCLALDDATSLSGPRFPLPGTRRAVFPIADQVVPQGPAYGTSIDVGSHAAFDVLAGIPILAGNASAVGNDAIVYFALQATGSAGSRILNAQVTPLRIDGSAERAFRIELGAVATDLRPGEHLELVVANQSDQFAHNAQRVPGLVNLKGVRLELPVHNP